MASYRPCVFFRQENARILTHGDVVHRDRLALPNEDSAKKVAIQLTRMVEKSIPNVQPGIEVVTFESALSRRHDKVLTRYVFDIPPPVSVQTANVRNEDTDDDSKIVVGEV